MDLLILFVSKVFRFLFSILSLQENSKIDLHPAIVFLNEEPHKLLMGEGIIIQFVPK